MSDRKTAVILCAGKSYRMWPICSFKSKLFLSLKNKPLIINIINSILETGIKRFIFICNKENVELIKLTIKKVYSSFIETLFLIQEHQNGPLSAFLLSYKYIDGPTMLSVSDSFVKLPLTNINNYLLLYKVNNNESKKYCVLNNGNLIDKKSINSKDFCDALVGTYYFNDYLKLKSTMKKILSTNIKNDEISVLLNEFGMEKFDKIYTEFWYDLGSIDNYYLVKNNNFQKREFNKLEIINNSIIKYTNNLNEINYYKELEYPTNKLFPQIYKLSSNFYEMEYIDYMNFSEYFKYYSFNFDNLLSHYKYIVYVINKNLWSQPNKYLYDKESLFKMYVEKTINRLSQWEKFLKLKSKKIIVNDEEYESFDILWKKINPHLEKIINTGNKYWRRIHGDLNFSNILFSFDNRQIKLIDPRGNFGNSVSDGDIRYEFAKLRQCYHGNYDYIMDDLYELDEIFINKYKLRYYFEQINFKSFDLILNKYKVDINEVEVIEALLFLSMIPLHYENKQRQMVFYIKGIELLNKAIKKGTDDYD